MKVLSDQRCTIGEGPIWNEREGKLYYTNGGGGKALCIYDPKTEALTVRALPFSAVVGTVLTKKAVARVSPVKLPWYFRAFFCMRRSFDSITFSRFASFSRRFF